MRRLHKTKKRTELVKSDDITPLTSWKDLKKEGALPRDKEWKIPTLKHTVSFQNCRSQGQDLSHLCLLLAG